MAALHAMKESDMIALALIAAAAATWLALRLRALVGSVPRQNDDMIFF
jgi:hypothetical protein